MTKKKEYQGWAVVDGKSRGILMSDTGQPFIFRTKTIARTFPYAYLYKIKKVKIIIEE